MIEGGHDVFVIGRAVLAFDSVSGDTEFDQCGRDIVLGAERVRGAENSIRAACFQG